VASGFLGGRSILLDPYREKEGKERPRRKVEGKELIPLPSPRWRDRGGKKINTYHFYPERKKEGTHMRGWIKGKKRGELERLGSSLVCPPMERKKKEKNQATIAGMTIGKRKGRNWGTRKPSRERRGGKGPWG